MKQLVGIALAAIVVLIVFGAASPPGATAQPAIAVRWEYAQLSMTRLEAEPFWRISVVGQFEKSYSA